MDRLRAYILAYQGRVERERLHHRISKLEQFMKTPNLAGVGPALAKLQHSLEAEAKKLLEDIEGAHAHGQDVFGQAKGKVKAAREGLTEVEKFIDDLDQASNGGPTLDDSSGSSGPANAESAPSIQQPQGSWAGNAGV